MEGIQYYNIYQLPLLRHSILVYILGQSPSLLISFNRAFIKYLSRLFYNKELVKFYFYAKLTCLSLTHLRSRYYKNRRFFGHKYTRAIFTIQVLNTLCAILLTYLHILSNLRCLSIVWGFHYFRLIRPRSGWNILCIVCLLIGKHTCKK